MTHRLAFAALFFASTLLHAGLRADEPAPTPFPGSDAGAPRSTWQLYPEYEHGMLRFERGEFAVSLGMRLQTLVSVWNGDEALLDEGDLMEVPGFRLRRTRITLDGQFIDGLTFGLGAELFDQEETDGPLLDAWLDYTPTHYIGVRLGAHKVPYSAARLHPALNLAFVERGLATRAMAPDRVAGATLHSTPWQDRLALQLGVYNGIERRSGSAYRGWEGLGTSLGNRFERLLVAARLDFEPLGPVGPEELDQHKTTSPLFAVGGGFIYSPAKTVTMVGAAGSLHFKWYGFSLFSEVLYQREWPEQQPDTLNVLPHRTERLTFVGQVGYTILRDLLALAFQVEWLDLNMDLEDNQDEIILSGVINAWVVRDLLKGQVQYSHREELHGVSRANDAVYLQVQLGF